jgi:hypothetical protein
MNFSSKYAGRVLAILAASTSLFLAVGCGSGSNLATPNNSGYSASNFSGTYVIAVSGTDITSTTESYFAVTGTIVADGGGNITGGSVDINDLDLASPGVFTAVTVNHSTYSVSPDGRGKATLSTANGTFGLDFVLTSNSHGLITRFDTSGTGSGTIDLQGSASQGSLASLAFSLSGVDYTASSTSLAPLSTVGAVTLNTSTGAITSGTEDFNDTGSSTQSGLGGLSITAGSVALSSGTNGTASLTTPSSFGTLQFDVWVIDSTHLKFIETDTANTGFALSGDAFTQQTSFPAGQLSFALAGLDSGLNPLVAGGFITTDVNGNLSIGTEDYNDEGTANTVTNVGGTCNATAPFASGRCELALTGFSNGSLNNFVFAAYPSSGGIQLLEIDNLGLLQGTAYAQTATSFTVPGGYGLNLSGVNSDGEGDSGEVDDIAQFNATTASTNNLTGVVDENSILGGNLQPSNLTGSFTPDSPATGRGTISATASGTSIGGLTLEYYVVDSSTAVFIEVDSQQLSIGTFELQSSTSSQVAARSHVMLIHPIAKAHGAKALKSVHFTRR